MPPQDDRAARVPLHPDDVVERRPDLTVHIDARGRVRVVVGDAWAEVGLAALDLLRRLSSPARVRDLLDAVPAAGAQAWMDASSTLLQLHRIRAVVRVGEAPVAASESSAAPFDSQFEQALMLHDQDRTSAFCRAIAETVRPGDVVVDIGTGTGVLALAAAQAGARRVYAVEAGAVAEVATAMFEGNGVADRVQVVRGWSTDLELPEKADVVVSETIGSEPLHEKVLEIFRDARLRLARPGARFVPERLNIFATAFQLPASWRQSFTPEAVALWSQRYHIDFTPLLRWQNRQRSNRGVAAEQVQAWIPLSEPALVASLDLTRVEDLSVDEEHLLPISAAGRLDALVTHFTASLSARVALSTDPRLGRPSSWLHPVRWIPPVQVHPGQQLVVAYRYQSRRPSGLSLVRVV